MSDSDMLGMLLIGLCLLASMFFSASETAITSMGDRHARRVLEEGGANAKAIFPWVNDPVRVLSTILVGNNLANTLLGSIVTALAIRHLSESGAYAVPLAVLISTAVLIIFGEILPKAFGKVHSHRIAMPALTILNVLSRVLSPITWSLSRMTRIVLRTSAPEGARVTSEDLDYLVKVGLREGSISADQGELLRGIFRFDDKIVRDIMVPQDRVTAINLHWELERISNAAKESGHSRLPVHEGNLDHLKGVLHIKSLVGIKDFDHDTIRRLMRPPLFVSESLFISDLLDRFKEQRVHLAIVVDDGGHTVGVVTLEDVLEQIVGKIFDESDRVPRVALNDGLGIKYFDGTSSVRSVEEAFGVELGVEEYDGVDSVGDLLSQLAGQIPIAGSLVVYEGFRFKILAANDRRVIRVSVERVEVDDESE